jgi:uncharacterized membrane protein YccC
MHWTVHDPDHAALRKAARATIVMPPLFAVCLVVLDNLQMATLASFGALATFLFADFGGPLVSRVGAYIGLTAVGSALVVIATLLSGSVWAAAAGMAVAAFVITLCSSAGGYVAAGASAAMLAFILCVTIPASAGEIPSRLAGWGMGSAAATIAAVVLWPRRERAGVMALGAELARKLGRLIDAIADPASNEPAHAELRSTLQSGSDAFMKRYAEMPDRPAGPTLHDQSLAYLAMELRRACEFGQELADLRSEPGVLGEDDEALAKGTARVLFDTADVLDSRTSEIDPSSLDRARRLTELTVEREIERGFAPEQVERQVALTFRLRVLSYLAFSMAFNAARLRRIRLSEDGYDPRPLTPEQGLAPALDRLREAGRTNLRPGSVWFQAALRSSIALGVAVLVALLVDLPHAFWVGLGAMTALKSSVATTGYTAWQAMLGTIAGFGLATAFLEAGGQSETALWVALPIGVFLTCYTPTAVHAVVGSAMFTVTVVILFNLIEPQGWRTGLIRVEDIGIGVATSVLVGLLLWPRGAGAQLRTRLAELYDASGTHVRQAVEVAVGRRAPDAEEHAASAAVVATRRAQDAYSSFLNERGPKRLPVVTWARVLTGGFQLRFVGDALVVRTRAAGAVKGLPETRDALDADADELERRIDAVGHSLVDPGVDRSALSPSGPLPAVSSFDGADTVSVLNALYAREWILHVRKTLAELEEPLEQVRTVGARPWWR